VKVNLACTTAGITNNNMSGDSTLECVLILHSDSLDKASSANSPSALFYSFRGT
jgi:hypothetical protein